MGKNKMSGFAHAVLIAVIIVVLIAIIGSVFVQNFISNNDDTTTLKENVASNDASSATEDSSSGNEKSVYTPRNWDRYTDEKTSISYALPKDWGKASIDRLKSGEYVDLAPLTGATIAIGYDESSSKWLQFSYNTKTDQQLKGLEYLKTLEVSKNNINDEYPVAIQRIGEGASGSYGISYMLFVMTENGSFTLTLPTSKRILNEKGVVVEETSFIPDELENIIDKFVRTIVLP